MIHEQWISQEFPYLLDLWQWLAWTAFATKLSSYGTSTDKCSGKYKYSILFYNPKNVGANFKHFWGKQGGVVFVMYCVVINQE